MKKVYISSGTCRPGFIEVSCSVDKYLPKTEPIIGPKTKF